MTEAISALSESSREKEKTFMFSAEWSCPCSKGWHRGGFEGVWHMARIGPKATSSVKRPRQSLGLGSTTTFRLI